MNLEYLNALKQKGNFTFETISKLSNVPEATVKNVFSGKTEDPRFDTLAAIVHAMGGSLDEYYKRTSAGKETDTHILSAIKELYEQRIADLKETIAGLRADRRHLWITVLVLGGFLVGALVVDMCVGSVGWFRY